MKYLFFSVISFLLWSHSFSQNFPIDEETKLITYTEVVKTEGTADLLYSKAHRWFFSYYKNPHNIVKKSENLKIVARPRFKILNPPDKKGIQTMGGIVLYTFTVIFKDGRYKYTITNIEWKQSSKYPIERWMDKSAASYKKKYSYYLEQVDKEITKTLALFKANVSQNKKKAEEEW